MPLMSVARTINTRLQTATRRIDGEIARVLVGLAGSRDVNSRLPQERQPRGEAVRRQEASGIDMKLSLVSAYSTSVTRRLEYESRTFRSIAYIIRMTTSRRLLLIIIESVRDVLVWLMHLSVQNA